MDVKRLLNSMLLIVALLAPIALFAQKQTGAIQGTVKTNDGKALPYASVLLKDTKYGTMADASGSFKFSANSGAYTLIVSYAGFVTSERKVVIEAGKTSEVGNIVINAASNQLREVVVADIQKNKYAKKNVATVAKMPLADLENSQSYSVVNKDFMQEIIATDYNSALISIPGAVVNNGVNDSGNDITMRGFVTNATFRNGLAINPRTQPEIVNVERVEILKGPSATLFGGLMSTYGGAVNTITKRPFESFRGEVGYTTGSWGLNRFTVDINTPLNEDRTALLRVNAASFTQNSFQDAGYSKGSAFAMSMAFKTSEKTTVRFDVDYFAPNKTLNAYIRNSNVLTVKTLAELNDVHDRTFTSNDIGSKRFQFNALAEIEHKISDNWLSRTSYQHSEGGEKGSTFLVLTYVDNTHVSRGIRPFDVYELTSDNIQQNFIGDFKIGNLRNRLVVGGDYLYRKTYNQFATYNINATLIPPIPPPAARYSVFMPYDVVTLDETTPWPAISKSEIVRKDNIMRSSTTGQSDMNFNFSGYISDALNITDWIVASAGLRVDRYEVKKTLLNGVAQTNNYVQTKVAPKFGLVVQPIKDQLAVFANYSNGFTNNPPTISATAGVINWKPTQANQAEVGLKTDLFDGKLSSTISYYDIKVTDMINTLPDGTTEQSGNQRSKGVEIEVIANPVQGLNIVTGFGKNDNKYTYYRVGATVDYSGNRVAWIPQNIFNFWASYKLLNGTAKGLGIGAGVNYSDDSYLDASNKAKTPAYTLFSATTFYDQPKYRVSLKVNNLGDKKYWNYYGVPQNPRQFVANISYKF